MIIETLRMVEAVLNDATLGANAQIDLLAMDTPNGGSSPDDRPGHVTVRNAVDTDPTVREVDTSFPLVVVDVAKPGSAQGQVWSGIRDFDVDVIIAYVTESGHVFRNERDTDYSLRAIVRSIARGLLAAGKRDTAGSRNGFKIFKSSTLKYGPTNQPQSSGVMTGAVEFTLTVRDLAP
ncbi:MAG: hypothetical protein ACJ8AK_03035 [Gemmatimonadaceae bacterium]